MYNIINDPNKIIIIIILFTHIAINLITISLVINPRNGGMPPRDKNINNKNTLSIDDILCIEMGDVFPGEASIILAPNNIIE